jgi:FAD/FMN-containing dehydrogenase/Fe-S oxidoreductase
MHLPLLNGNGVGSKDAGLGADAASLRGLVNAVSGEVRLDLHNRMLYATDASLYQVEPLGVVIPDSTDDAVAAARYCLEVDGGRGIAMLPRGGGTSLAGQCTNRAVVIDLSPKCRAVGEVDVGKRLVRVEPGVTVDDLNDIITKRGSAAGGELFFAPDPATSRHATVGGCIGNNAAGARSILFGRTSENVSAVEAWVPSLNRRVWLGAGSAGADEGVRELTRRVVDVCVRHAGLIKERFPKTVRRNAGYGLDMVLGAYERGGNDLNAVNLAHLLCGSEGTLAMTLGAELMLREKPKAKGLAVLGFSSLDESIASVMAILTTGPSAVELLDDTVVDLARANGEYRRYVDLMPQPTTGVLKAVLYVEYFGASVDEVKARMESLRRMVPGVACQMHTDAGAMLNAWKLRKAGEPLLHGIPGARKPITFVEDNAVPVERLSEFVTRFRGIVEKHGTRAAYYAHASVGVLHVRPLIDIHDADDRVRMRAIAVEVADLARELGGVMSGEHGDGRIRGPLLERFFGAELMGAFAEVKRAFDPKNLMNPGGVVDLDGKNPRPIESMTQELRVEPRLAGAVDEGRRPVPVGVGEVRTFFDYGEEGERGDSHGFDHAVEMCNGAGVCRKKQGGTMCPSYMATLDERHSTRGRGNALRLAITGQFGEPARWNDPGTIETLNLCLSCKACKTECPSNVDIARLKAEFTAQRYARQGSSLQAKVFGNVRLLNRLGAIAPEIANAVNGWGITKRMLGSVLGFDSRRSVPAFARSLEKRWGRGLAVGQRTERRKVAFFGDCFAMFNEPGIGLAAKRVFERCGYEVVLANAGCCGRAKISTGLLPEAIAELDATYERLEALLKDDAIEAVLVAEPSCLSSFKDDALGLKLRTPMDVRKRIAAKCFLPEEYLAKMWGEHPKQPRFAKESGEVLLHGHCHQKALWGAETSAAALKLVFGDRVKVLDTGCCGMAGSFGYTKDRYDLSMKIGELTLFPAVRAAQAKDADVKIAAPGTSCRHQVHDGTGCRAKHPIELIAEAMAD